MASLIRELIRPYRRTLALILGALLVEAAMRLALPWPLKIILDNVVGSSRLPQWVIDWLLPPLGGDSKMHIAVLAAISAVIIAALIGIAFYVGIYYTEGLAQWMGNDLRQRMYHHLHCLSLGYFKSHQLGTILSTITADVETIETFASQSTINMFVNALTIVGMTAVMFWLRWDFALIALALTPFLVIFFLRANTAIRKAVTEARKRESDMLATLQEGLGSIEVVQAFERQDLAEQQLAQVSKAIVAAWLKFRRVVALLSPAIGLGVALCTAIVLWRGASLILAGAMTVGILTVFLSYLARFFEPVYDLARMTDSIAQVSVGIQRIQTILDTSTVIPQRPNAITPPPFLGEITFEHVAFAYDPARPVLSDVCFTVAPGQLVGVVGKTGCGKTTLARLIPRLYDPDCGNIRIDGIDVRDYTLHGLRSQIGVVLQNTVLFRGTVRDNIAFGRSGATEDEIVRAAELANAHEFISRMPYGYDSLVGERGLTLSAGQCQRIGIARALVRDNPILILDEPTAALDAESEELVVDAVKRLMKDRSVICIAHRLSTVRNADKIIVLDDGTVAEEGTHEQLLMRDGLYAELYRIQFEQKSV